MIQVYRERPVQRDCKACKVFRGVPELQDFKERQVQRAHKAIRDQLAQQDYKVMQVHKE